MAAASHGTASRPPGSPPFCRLEYLYVGSADVGKDLRFYRDVLGAEVVWDHTASGTRVAAVRLGEGPLWLLAGHRRTPSAMPIWLVPDLAKAERTLKERGWKEAAEPVEVPDGPCLVFHDPSGNPLAILQSVRPHALEGSD